MCISLHFACLCGRPSENETMIKDSLHSKENPTVAVFYLLRKGNNVLHFASFLDSLRRHVTYVRYIPVVIQKGFPSGFRHPLIGAWTTRDGRRAQCIEVSDEGYDLLAYRKASGQFKVDYCLFFNSYCRILGDLWLDHYISAAEKCGENCIIGATGSWQRPTLADAFPNMHIRSNAFLISRKLYLSFDNPLITKDDSYELEHGALSMTNIVLDSGGRVAVVDRNGRVLFPDRWPSENIFWRGDQELLLVSDNRTADYQGTNPRRRRRFSMAAWGEDRCHVVSHSRLKRHAYALRTKGKMLQAYFSLLLSIWK